jgi:hypothetical protein
VQSIHYSNAREYVARLDTSLRTTVHD